MSFRFKPEDFRHLECCDSFFPGEVATTANQLLDEHVATLPEVVGLLALGQELWHRPSDLDKWDQIRAHTAPRARLWGVEEIKQKKCEEHEPVYQGECESAMPSVWVECKHCGKRLIAKWEEAE